MIPNNKKYLQPTNLGLEKENNKIPQDNSSIFSIPTNEQLLFSNNDTDIKIVPKLTGKKFKTKKTTYCQKFLSLCCRCFLPKERVHPSQQINQISHKNSFLYNTMGVNRFSNGNISLENIEEEGNKEEVSQQYSFRPSLIQEQKRSKIKTEQILKEKAIETFTQKYLPLLLVKENECALTKIVMQVNQVITLVSQAKEIQTFLDSQARHLGDHAEAVTEIHSLLNKYTTLDAGKLHLFCSLLKGEPQDATLTDDDLSNIIEVLNLKKLLLSPQIEVIPHPLRQRLINQFILTTSDFSTQSYYQEGSDPFKQNITYQLPKPGSLAKHSLNFCMEIYSQQLCQQPYPDGSSRANHATSHAARQMAYFKKMLEDIPNKGTEAAKETLKEILSKTTIDNLVFCVFFTRTGRINELGFNAKTNYCYQNRSADLLCSALSARKHSSWYIARMKDVFLNLFNPNYENTLKDLTPAEKNKRIFLKTLIKWAHELDLPRCWKKSRVDQKRSAYKTDESIHKIFNNQGEYADELFNFSLACLQATGDGFYVDDSDNKILTKKEIFAECEGDVSIAMRNIRNVVSAGMKGFSTQAFVGDEKSVHQTLALLIQQGKIPKTSQEINRIFSFLYLLGGLIHLNALKIKVSFEEIVQYLGSSFKEQNTENAPIFSHLLAFVDAARDPSKLDMYWSSPQFLDNYFKEPQEINETNPLFTLEFIFAIKTLQKEVSSIQAGNNGNKFTYNCNAIETYFAAEKKTFDILNAYLRGEHPEGSKQILVRGLEALYPDYIYSKDDPSLKKSLLGYGSFIKELRHQSGLNQNLSIKEAMQSHQAKKDSIEELSRDFFKQAMFASLQENEISKRVFFPMGLIFGHNGVPLVFANDSDSATGYGDKETVKLVYKSIKSLKNNNFVKWVKKQFDIIPSQFSQYSSNRVKTNRVKIKYMLMLAFMRRKNFDLSPYIKNKALLLGLCMQMTEKTNYSAPLQANYSEFVVKHLANFVRENVKGFYRLQALEQNIKNSYSEEKSYHHVGVNKPFLLNVFIGKMILRQMQFDQALALPRSYKILGLDKIKAKDDSSYFGYSDNVNLGQFKTIGEVTEFILQNVANVVLLHKEKNKTKLKLDNMMDLIALFNLERGDNFRVNMCDLPFLLGMKEEDFMEAIQERLSRKNNIKRQSVTA